MRIRLSFQPDTLCSIYSNHFIHINIYSKFIQFKMNYTHTKPRDQRLATGAGEQDFSNQLFETIPDLDFSN